MHPVVVIIIYRLEGTELSGGARMARIWEVSSDEISDRDPWKLVGHSMMKDLFTLVSVPPPGGNQVSSRACVFLVERLLPSSSEHSHLVPFSPSPPAYLRAPSGGGAASLSTEHARSAQGVSSSAAALTQ